MNEEEQVYLAIGERGVAVATLLMLAGFGFFDFAGDLRAGSPWSHLITEMVISISGASAAIWLVSRFLRVRRQLVSTRNELHSSLDEIARHRADAERWKAESARLLSGLSQAIDAQFERWQLSPAESEIALLLLKGFSLKEIADLRSVSERTVRHQTLAIYEKSGTAGRAELAAFFLEDLLLPPRQTSDESSFARPLAPH